MAANEFSEAQALSEWQMVLAGLQLLADDMKAAGNTEIAEASESLQLRLHRRLTDQGVTSIATGRVLDPVVKLTAYTTRDDRLVQEANERVKHAVIARDKANIAAKAWEDAHAQLARGLSGVREVEKTSRIRGTV